MASNDDKRKALVALMNVLFDKDMPLEAMAEVVVKAAVEAGLPVNELEAAIARLYY